MAATFYAQILSQFDWEAIVAEAAEAGLNGEGVYLGSVLSLTPLGKFYTLFAHGNVSRKEWERDEAWWEAFEKVLEKHGLFYQYGPDPVDILVFDLNGNFEEGWDW